MQHTRADTMVLNVGRELCLAPCKGKYTRAQLLTLNTPLGLTIQENKAEDSCQMAAEASNTGKQSRSQLPKELHEEKPIRFILVAKLEVKDPTKVEELSKSLLEYKD
ncbi:hypothetical protein NDU88_006314 [Pleurodeles waltl]|uniref:Uncharacterized protein n=1 Tax=Pleurodeles waltl TaxID=8319 RepID=A0AAV7WX85_PLEWA|nr:hypothetical protein NDU88_006314 [Pleurodeles waltl]